MSAKSTIPNPTSYPSLSETQSNNRVRSTTRKRQLSKASDEEMKPPTSRPRSQSQARTTDDSGEIIFKTQGQSFNMTNLIETTLTKQNSIHNIISSIVKETNKQLKPDLKRK